MLMTNPIDGIQSDSIEIANYGMQTPKSNYTIY